MRSTQARCALRDSGPGRSAGRLALGLRRLRARATREHGGQMLEDAPRTDRPPGADPVLHLVDRPQQRAPVPGSGKLSEPPGGELIPVRPLAHGAARYRGAYLDLLLRRPHRLAARR